MDLTYGERYEAFRAELREFLTGWPLRGAEAELPASEQERIFRRRGTLAGYVYRTIPAESPRAAAIAKAHVPARASEVARAAVELHGGLGFTWECDVQLWFKRAMFDRAWSGNPEHHLARIAALGDW